MALPTDCAGKGLESPCANLKWPEPVNSAICKNGITVKPHFVRVATQKRKKAQQQTIMATTHSGPFICDQYGIDTSARRQAHLQNLSAKPGLVVRGAK
ncbi:MAG: hypothetical protein CO093_08575 [Alphaproteobacteria bacterium CG_4_9_14_3_um_filter_47_13]|nr:MAG: hypothetical protein CO093_08575 [Alphaproteobacteria bacterium CG_4_9_14_3_um_filter_47_13]